MMNSPRRQRNEFLSSGTGEQDWGAAMANSVTEALLAYSPSRRNRKKVVTTTAREEEILFFDDSTTTASSPSSLSKSPSVNKIGSQHEPLLARDGSSIGGLFEAPFAMAISRSGSPATVTEEDLVFRNHDLFRSTDVVLDDDLSYQDEIQYEDEEEIVVFEERSRPLEMQDRQRSAVSATPTSCSSSTSGSQRLQATPVDLSTLVIDETPPSAQAMRPDPWSSLLSREQQQQPNSNLQKPPSAEGAVVVDSEAAQTPVKSPETSQYSRRPAVEANRVESVHRLTNLSTVTIDETPPPAATQRPSHLRAAAPSRAATRKTGKAEKRPADEMLLKKGDSERSLTDLSVISIDETPPPPTTMRPEPWSVRFPGKAEALARKVEQCYQSKQSNSIHSVDRVDEAPSPPDSTTLLEPTPRISNTTRKKEETHVEQPTPRISNATRKQEIADVEPPPAAVSRPTPRVSNKTRKRNKDRSTQPGRVRCDSFSSCGSSAIDNSVHGNRQPEQRPSRRPTSRSRHEKTAAVSNDAASPRRRDFQRDGSLKSLNSCDSAGTGRNGDGPCGTVIISHSGSTPFGHLQRGASSRSINSLSSHGHDNFDMACGAVVETPSVSRRSHHRQRERINSADSDHAAPGSLASRSKDEHGPKSMSANHCGGANHSSAAQKGHLPKNSSSVSLNSGSSFGWEDEDVAFGAVVQTAESSRRSRMQRSGSARSVNSNSISVEGGGLPRSLRLHLQRGASARSLSSSGSSVTDQLNALDEGVDAELCLHEDQGHREAGSGSHRTRRRSSKRNTSLSNRSNPDANPRADHENARPPAARPRSHHHHNHHPVASLSERQHLQPALHQEEVGQSLTVQLHPHREEDEEELTLQAMLEQNRSYAAALSGSKATELIATPVPAPDAAVPSEAAFPELGASVAAQPSAPAAAAPSLASDLDAAAEFLSKEELELIKQALQESNTQSPGAEEQRLPAAEEPGLSKEELEQIQAALKDEVGTAAVPEETHQPNSGFSGVGISEDEAAAIERAIREADAAEEAQSLQLAQRMHEEEERWRAEQLAASTPQGNVRTMTRAGLRAEQAASAGAYSDAGQPRRHPLQGDMREDEDLGVVPGGFRMNASSEHEWSRRRMDQSTIVSPDGEMRTKHDAALDSQANIHRLGLDDDDVSGIGSRTFNSFRQSMKRSTKKGVALHGTGRAGSDADGTKGGALDAASFEQITKAINAGWMNKLNGLVKEGKEAVVYHADAGAESGGFDVAVKIFKRIQEFRNRGDYVDGDPRFESMAFKDNSKRQQLALWTEKEYRNLVRASRAGVPVPTPLTYKDNLLWMRFLGTNGWPAPQLRELELRKSSKRWAVLYQQVMDAVRTLYGQAHLVHADLSEYNILVVPAHLVENRDARIENPETELQAVLIDFGQAVGIRHPEARTWLERDLDRVSTFFTRQGVTCRPVAEALEFVLAEEPEAQEDAQNP